MLILVDLGWFSAIYNFKLSAGPQNTKPAWKKWVLDSYDLTSKSMDAKIISLDTVTAIVYILKPAVHLDQYSLISSIFPVITFLSREEKSFFFKNVSKNSSKTAIS